MTHTIGELKESVAGLLQGTTLTNVTGLNNALERAARNLAQQADIPEAMGMHNFMLYDGVYDYNAPEAIFGGALIDCQIQGVSRNPQDYVYKVPIEQFDRTKKLLPNGYMFTFEWNVGSPIMRIASPIPVKKVELDGMSSTDDWTVGGSSSALSEDTTVFYQQPASLRFTLTGASSGYQEKTLQNAISMESYEGVGVMFLAIYAPTASSLTNISVRLGSDSSNYTEVTETEGFLGAWTSNEWLLVALDLSAGTDTGTPDYTAIQYIRVTETTSATITNFRIGGLFVSLPSAHTLIYETDAIFATSGVMSRSITNDGTVVILNDASYLLYEHECALTIALQMGGGMSTPLVQLIRGILHGNGNDMGLYARYRADNPSQELRMVGNWYSFN